MGSADFSGAYRVQKTNKNKLSQRSYCSRCTERL